MAEQTTPVPTPKPPAAQDLSDELWREYDFGGRVYRIDNPVSLYVGKTTHRVVDAKGLVHCVPTVGHLGCVLRWQPKDAGRPVAF